MAERTTPEDVWAKIDQTAGPNECWPWTGRVDADGYGLIYIVNKKWRVHRWVLAQSVGPLFDDEVARHTCDNPPCCNPAHLVRGSQAENSQDMTDRRRRQTGADHWTARHPELVQRGEKNAAASITADVVRDIRSRHAAGETQTSLSREYEISQGHISNIILRKKWAHIKE